MSNYKKHVDNFFKEKLGNYREPPPPDAWDELESRLDGLTPAPSGFPYRWIWHVGIVSVILLLSVSLLKKYTGNSSQSSDNLAMNQSSATTQGSGNTVSPATTATSATTINGQTGNTGTSNPTAANSSTATTEQTSANNVTGNNTAGNGNQAINHPSVTANKGKTAYSSGKNRSAANAARRRGTGTNNTYNSTYTQAGKTTNNSLTAFNTTSGKTSTLSNPAPEDESTNQALSASPNTTLSVVSDPKTQAKEQTKPATKPNTSIAAKNSNTRTKPSFARIETGVKAGYEGGFNNEAANKFVISPYVQYNLSPKLAVMTQPGIKYAMTPDRTIGSPQAYYNYNSENTTLTQGQVKETIIGTTEYYTTTYTYTEQHDSIVKTNKIGGGSMEFEIPLLLKYNLTKKLSVYGGVNFVYNKYTTINENTYAKNVTRSIIDTVTSINSMPTPPQGLGFTYTGKPISEYQKLNAAHTGYELSTGYMIGFSYACSKKWLLDALVEQSSAPSDIKAGYNINTPLSSTYFRLSIGYKIK